MLTSLASTIASGFGSGRAPKAAGTFGSLACVFAWWAGYTAFPQYATLPFQALVAIIVFLLGWWAVDRCFSKLSAESLNGRKELDPSWVVIDEWAGQLVALLPCATLEYPYLIAAFFLFRFFDIWKKGPIAAAENLGGPHGVMLDDMVAGIFAALVILGLKQVFSFL